MIAPASAPTSREPDHPAPEQVGDSDQRGANRRVADPPTKRMVAEEQDAERDYELGQRRMRIEE